MSQQLLRVESDPQFYGMLQRAVLAKQPLFTEEVETKAWNGLLALL